MQVDRYYVDGHMTLSYLYVSPTRKQCFYLARRLTQIMHAWSDNTKLLQLRDSVEIKVYINFTTLSLWRSVRLIIYIYMYILELLYIVCLVSHSLVL